MKNQEKTEYQKYLEELCDPNYSGGSWVLPENPSPLEQAKYDICQKLIKYKRNKQLTTENLAQKIQLSKAETEDILYCRLDYFTLDRLMDYTNKLFSPCEVKITIEKKESGKTTHAETL